MISLHPKPNRYLCGRASVGPESGEYHYHCSRPAGHTTPGHTYQYAPPEAELWDWYNNDPKAHALGELMREACRQRPELLERGTSGA